MSARFSAISDSPGPEVAVMARAPAVEAAKSMAEEATSLSACIKCPPA